MLKITPVEGSGRALKLEGKLTGAWVEELARACTASTPESPVTLDLSSVNYADAAGAALLRSLSGTGAVIAACSPYLAELLRGEQAR